MKKTLYASLFLLFIVLQKTAAQQVTGILGAFPPELVLLQSKMENKRDTLIMQVKFVRGTLSGKPVVLAQTGIGKVNAAVATALMIEHFKPREIVFSGIAGGIDPALSPGDIVIGTEVTYHDFGTVTDSAMVYRPTANPFNMQENPLAFACDPALVARAIKASRGLSLEKIVRENGSFEPLVREGVIVTGDVFVSSENATSRLQKDLHAAATEMEGAAIAQTCYQYHTPFLIIRSMSDKANSKAKNDMMAFYQTAAKNAAVLVMAVVGSL